MREQELDLKNSHKEEDKYLKCDLPSGYYSLFGDQELCIQIINYRSNYF